MYSEQFMMLLAVFERAALMLMTLFLLTRTQLFQSIVKKTHRRPVETAMISALFILFAVFSTYTGLNVDGSLVNVRIIAVLSGGIIFGPWIGIPAGIIAGIHRYLIDVDGPTSVACLITSIFAGLLATWIHCKCAKKNYAQLGILAGMCCEILTMVLIVALSHNKALAYNIVTHISFPMILGTLSIGLIIKLVQDLDEEQDLIAAQQAKLALEIANKTLPYFRINNRNALQKVCSIIRFYTGADAVAITNTQDVRAYVGRGEEHFLDAHHKISQMTRQAVESGEQIISNNLNVHNFHSLLIIPLWENGEVSGTLKIFYCQPDHIRMSLREMAIGLSQIISFLRYNLERDVELIDIQEEIQQVRDYVAIEQARFGSKLEVVFDIDDVHPRIPCLLIQPLVENAILHGIQPSRVAGKVVISVKKCEDDVVITITDTGVGIDQEIIDKLYQSKIDSHHIGLNNVHQRLLLLYSEGLHISRLEQGTSMQFFIKEQD
jgi:two-component system LytT family sensor kinase